MITSAMRMHRQGATPNKTSRRMRGILGLYKYGTTHLRRAYMVLLITRLIFFSGTQHIKTLRLNVLDLEKCWDKARE